MASIFEGKTKADLVKIAREFGLLKTTVSQKMSKAELLAFLEEANNKQVLSDVDSALQSKKDKSESKANTEKVEQDQAQAANAQKSQPQSKQARTSGRKEASKGRSKRRDEKKDQNTEDADKKRDSRKSRSKQQNQKADLGKDSLDSDEKLDLDPGDLADIEVTEEEEKKLQSGILEVMPDGYGFIRIENYIQGPNDLYLPPQYIRRFKLRTGDYIVGPSRQQRDSDRYPALYYIKEVNGRTPEEVINRPSFDRLTPIYPNERLVLETSRHELSARIIDLVSPIGKGQRGMIVSPPKAGKTILLKKIANAISENNPETKLIVLLIDERPEEVTDMQRSIDGEVVFSTFDKSPENHVKITELVLERAKRLVEHGEDVVILLDSITRMSRAYNLTINPTGRTLSGGLDPGALYGPKRFFGAARNIEQGGSLTIIATALVETGSRMDEVIFEEFKGTGNMEVYLDRKLAEKRIFPAIDMIRSGTRREELLLSQDELNAIWGIRRTFGHSETSAVTESLINLMLKTKNNAQFVSSINVSLNDQKLLDALQSSMGLMTSKTTSGNGNGNTNKQTSY